MIVDFHLGASKYWWAYLGLKSNRQILELAQGSERAVFFDDPRELATISAARREGLIQYFLIFWDGVSDPGLFEESRRILGKSAALRALVVGEASGLEPGQVTSLYAEGPLRFDVGPLHFETRTARQLLTARAKAWTMPAKNILQNRVSWRAQVDLLTGRPRLVFCGSYGTIPQVMRSLCERHGVAFEVFAGYPYYIKERTRSLDQYAGYVARDALFLARLFERGQIPEALLLSAVHLLGREYFVEKIRAARLPFYVNGYATGINVNVYTTPWYRQHVFPDFGSAVGTGNYPRLADLQYFRKRYVPVPLNDDPERTLAAVRNGTLVQHFEGLWESVHPALVSALGS